MWSDSVFRQGSCGDLTVAKHFVYAILYRFRNIYGNPYGDREIELRDLTLSS